MLNQKKKLFSYILVFVMVFSLFGGTALAVENDGRYLEGDAIPPTSSVDCSTYLVVEPASETSIDVTFVIEAGDALEDYEISEGSAFRLELPVSMSKVSGLYTVTDLLDEVNGSNGLEFYGANNSAFTASTDYLDTVVYDDGIDEYTWKAGSLGFDGWVFRVNDKFPVRVTSDLLGYEGTSILQTYLEDGDVVHFFYDLPSDLDSTSGSIAAKYVRGIYDSSSTGSLTVQLQAHTTYIEPVSPFIYNVNNYIDMGSGVVARLYDSSGNPIGTSQTSGSNGKVTFTNAGIGSGTYILKTNSVLYETNDPGWDWLVNGVYFELTGAYSKIIIP